MALVMLAKVLVIVIFFGILLSLGSALFFVVKDKGSTDRAVRALSFRIGISVGLFALLFVLWMAGIIEPHGINR